MFIGSHSRTALLDAGKALARGGIVGALGFLAFVLAVGTISYHSDRSLIDEKISAAIQDGTIQIPGTLGHNRSSRNGYIHRLPCFTVATIKQRQLWLEFVRYASL
jgi:hypothetical protein